MCHGGTYFDSLLRMINHDAKFHSKYEMIVGNFTVSFEGNFLFRLLQKEKDQAMVLQDLTSNACDHKSCHPLSKQEETLTLAYPTQDFVRALTSDLKFDVSPTMADLFISPMRALSYLSFNEYITMTNMSSAETIEKARNESNQCLFHPPYC